MAQRASSEQIPIWPLLRAAGLLAAVAAPILLAFVFMRDSGVPKALIAVVARTIGIGGVWGMFSAGNGVVDALPRRLRDAVRPWLFVGPRTAPRRTCATSRTDAPLRFVSFATGSPYSGQGCARMAPPRYSRS